MKEKIKEINDYFVNRLVNGEYIVKESNEHITTVLIDDYRFDVWLSNGPDRVATNISVHNSFMNLDFTPVEQQMIYSNLHNHKLEVKLKQKLDQYEALKKELGL